MKQFSYGDYVKVTLPKNHGLGPRVFYGTVYSQYFSRVTWVNGRRVRGERVICVNHPKGGGVGYRIRYVTKVRRRSRDIATRSVR